MDRFLRTVAPALTLGAGAAAIAQQGFFADLAPADSVIAFGVDDVEAARAAWDASALRAMWEDPEVRDYIDAMFEDARELAMQDEGEGDPDEGLVESFRRQLEDAGIDPDQLRWPGAAGGAMFFGAADWSIEGDADGEEGGAMRVQALFSARFADLERADAAWDALERMAEKAEDDGKAQIGRAAYGGVEIMKIAEVPAQFDGEEFDEFASEPMFDGFVLAQVGETIAASTQLGALRTIIDRLEGVGAGPALDEDEDYRATMAQHPQGAQVWGAAMSGPIRAMFTGEARNEMLATIEGFAPGMGDMLATASAMMDALGLSEVKAASMTARLGGDGAVFESTTAALVPEKRGLVELFDGPSQSLVPPAWVGEDAVAVTSFRMEMSGVIPLVRSLIATLPEEERAQTEMMAGMFMGMLEPVFTALGDRVTTATFIDRPFDPNSRAQVVAMHAKDPQGLSEALGMAAANFGMTPRDFQGNPIFESDFAPNFAIGAGFGQMFMGPAPAVERALRAAGDSDQSRLAASDAFKRDMRAVADEGIGFSYQQVRPELEYASWTAQNLEKIWSAQWDEFGVDDPESKEMFMESMREATPDFSRRPIPVRAILRHVGNTATDFRSTPEGFVSRTVVLSAGE